MSYDLAILGNPEQTVPDLTINNTANDGAYKLLQRVMILLLTDTNAENNPGGVGTDIPSLLRGGNVPEPETLSNLFATALVEIKTALLSGITPESTEDEIPETLKAFVIPNEEPSDTVTVEIQVLTRAGTEVTVSVPISNITTGE